MTADEQKRELRWILLDGTSCAAGELPIADDPFPPRPKADVTDILSSVRIHGVISPILVRIVGGRYQIVCGYRRYLAARTARLTEIPALVADLSDAAAVRCYLATKILHRSIGDAEQERAFTMLKELREAEKLPTDVPAQEIAEELAAETLAADAIGAAPRPPSPAPGAPAEGCSRIRPAVDDEAAAQGSSSRLQGLADVDGPSSTSGLSSTSGPASVDGQATIQQADRLAGSLLLSVESLFAEVRRTRTIDVEHTNEIVDELLAILDGGLPVDLRRLCHGAQDDITASHSILVGALSAHVGRILGWNGDELRRFVVAGLLHDVGMVFVREASIRQARALTQAERAELHSHVRIGCALVAGTQVWSGEVASCARDHHERWDGSGYPGGAMETTVSFPARLMGLLDTYGALVAPRPHRDALTPRAAAERIAKALELGLFDPSFHFLLRSGLSEQRIPGLEETSPRIAPAASAEPFPGPRTLGPPTVASLRDRNSVESVGELATMLSVDRV